MAGYTIFLASPFIEINQLATFGTERPPGIVLPFDPLPARWTFRHQGKSKKDVAKSKATGAASVFAGTARMG